MSNGRIGHWRHSGCESGILRGSTSRIRKKLAIDEYGIAIHFRYPRRFWVARDGIIQLPLEIEKTVVKPGGSGARLGRFNESSNSSRTKNVPSSPAKTFSRLMPRCDRDTRASRHPGDWDSGRSRICPGRHQSSGYPSLWAGAFAPCDARPSALPVCLPPLRGCCGRSARNAFRKLLTHSTNNPRPLRLSDIRSWERSAYPQKRVERYRGVLCFRTGGLPRGSEELNRGVVRAGTMSAGLNRFRNRKRIHR